MYNNGGNEDAAANSDNGGSATSNNDNANAIDTMAKQIQSLRAGMENISRILCNMCTMQRINDGILRKSANSINVVVRLLAGHCHLDNQILWETLISSDALLDNVKPSTDMFYDDIPVDYPKLHHMKYILLDLIKMIEFSEDDRDAETANSTHNDIPDDRRPSTSSSNTQSTSGISSYIENSQSMSNVSVLSDTISAQNVSNSEILLDTPLTSHNKNPDRNSIKTNRISMRCNRIPVVMGTNNKSENLAPTETISVPLLTGKDKCTDRNDTSIQSDGLTLHNNRPIDKQELLKDTKAKDKIQNVSCSKINSDPQLADDKRDNRTVNSLYSNMTSAHLAFVGSSMEKVPVESKEASALRRKYNNKYRYMENYKNTNRSKLPAQNDNYKVINNVSHELVEKTKTEESAVHGLQSKVTYNFDMHDCDYMVKTKTNCVERFQSKISDKTNYNHQVVKQNKRTADHKKECNDNAVICPRGTKSILKEDNDKPTNKKKRLNVSSSVK